MAGYKVIALTLVLVIMLVVCLPTVVSAQILRDALRVFGIFYVVRTFGGEINSFINSLLGQHGVEWEGVTKVVPIISVGRGTAIGAAQVQGPVAQVDRVRGVGQLEAAVGDFRGRLLIPVDTTTPTEDLSRVRGVGVSALIDFVL